MYDSSRRTAWKRRTHRGSKSTSGCHVLGSQRRMNSQSTGDLQGSENILDAVIRMDTHHDKCSKPPRVSPDVR